MCYFSLSKKSLREPRTWNRKLQQAVIFIKTHDWCVGFYTRRWRIVPKGGDSQPRDSLTFYYTRFFGNGNRSVDPGEYDPGAPAGLLEQIGDLDCRLQPAAAGRVILCTHQIPDGA